ncbi:flagellar hook-basal body protein [Desulfoluna butyratoxydans]|uniref:Fagellar hook-basal body protein flge/f/g n=1 Tax=Desulfoluna butyratoxydans TaxID=231438 RepID=A0A4V6ILT6_9BACT|nr:flagellar hook-basal body protein [Desulfoluna butyratoxydans]VFQ46358.1 fagellar hook-basal body protein flge/f/g [Desulfoluna butyratoxydans]
MLFEMTRSAQAGLRKERQHELISNHLANANTTGFKKDILSFDRTLNPILTTDFSQGNLMETGNPLDLAIEGEGFFKINTPSGTRYTRDGNFTVDPIGRMVTQDGHPVMGKNGPVTLTGNDIAFGEKGEVILDSMVFDSLDLVTANDMRAFIKEGGNLFTLDPQKGAEIPAYEARIHQGALEGANISTVTEMTHLIDAQRMFESSGKVMRTSDETDARANQMGRPA